jgi:hypothetical protein
MNVDRDAAMKRLPKWARSEIERLHLNVEHWRQKAGVGVGESDTFAGDWPGYGGTNARPLGVGERIYFALHGDGTTPAAHDEGWDEHIQVYVGLDGAVPVLHVSAPKPLRVSPRASNSVMIELGERR